MRRRSILFLFSGTLLTIILIVTVSNLSSFPSPQPFSLHWQTKSESRDLSDVSKEIDELEEQVSDLEVRLEKLRERQRKVKQKSASENRETKKRREQEVEQKSISHKDKAEITENISQKMGFNRVMSMYYPWYGNPEDDGKYIHWNHRVLEDNGRILQPPKEIGSRYLPQLGLYSSKNKETVLSHMEQMSRAGTGTVCISWWGKGTADEQGGFTDSVTSLVIKSAEEVGLSVVFHIEPYEGRTATSVANDIKYILDEYGQSKALFRWKNRAVIFVYDSYLIRTHQWADVLGKLGSNSIRGTEYDSIVIGLLVEEKHQMSLQQGGFDGMYTYFATNGFVWGSSWGNWKIVKSFCEENGMIFVPCVGPGYDDTSVRPWNSINTRNREGGEYYSRAWKEAMDVNPLFVGVTSFNEWHEGTQIESAVPKEGYLDYLPHDPEYYLDLTRQHVEKYLQMQSNVEM